MRRTYKYRVHPSKAQITKFETTLDLCRWVYNQTLETRKNAWEEDEVSIGYLETKRMLPGWKETKPELKQVHSQVLQDVVQRVNLAYEAFFRRVENGDEEPGYPKFKSWKHYDSFTYPQHGSAFYITDDGRLHLSKIGDIEINLHRPVEGQIKTLTIKRSKLGKWYACFSCVVEPEPLPETTDIVGIDVGLSTFATFSDGEKIENPRFFKREEKQLNRMRSRRDKAPKGSLERKKLHRAVLHIEERIRNRRTDFAHKESKELVDRFQIIVFEDLDIKDMMSGNWKSMNRSIADVAWGQFVRFTQEKAQASGRTVILVDPKNTTQECSKCHKIVQKGLSDRIHSCPHCGLEIDRDVNAARNVLARGLACIG